MARVSARIPDTTNERIAKVIKVYGGDTTSVLLNALDFWLDAFAGAPELKRLQMIVRPQQPKAVVRPSANAGQKSRRVAA